MPLANNGVHQHQQEKKHEGFTSLSTIIGFSYTYCGIFSSSIFGS
jgi:hypothetical protein